jgi:hypothetical protein
LQRTPGECRKDNVEDNSDIVAYDARKRAGPQGISEVLTNHVIAKQHHASCKMLRETTRACTTRTLTDNHPGKREHADNEAPDLKHCNWRVSHSAHATRKHSRAGLVSTERAQPTQPPKMIMLAMPKPVQMSVRRTQDRNSSHLRATSKDSSSSCSVRTKDPGRCSGGAR